VNRKEYTNPTTLSTCCRDHLDTFVINFQSIVSKQADFSLFINNNCLDIILGTEKMVKGINQVYYGYGGVLIRNKERP